MYDCIKFKNDKTNDFPPLLIFLTPLLCSYLLSTRLVIALLYLEKLLLL